MDLTPTPAKSLSASPTPPRHFRPPMPYDQPIPGGRCAFAELPEEVLEQVLLRLDLQELTRCFRVSLREADSGGAVKEAQRYEEWRRIKEGRRRQR